MNSHFELKYLCYGTQTDEWSFPYLSVLKRDPTSKSIVPARYPHYMRPIYGTAAAVSRYDLKGGERGERVSSSTEGKCDWD